MGKHERAEADQANLGLFHNLPRDRWLEADVERTTRSEDRSRGL